MNITVPVLGIKSLYQDEIVNGPIEGALIDKGIARIIYLLNNKHNCITWASCSHLLEDHPDGMPCKSAYIGFHKVTNRVRNILRNCDFVEEWGAGDGGNFYYRGKPEDLKNTWQIVENALEKSEVSLWEKLWK